MARGVRKSALERKLAELNEIRETIVTYENALTTMRQNEKELLEEIELEEVKKLNEALKANNVSVDDMLAMLENSKINIA